MGQLTSKRETALYLGDDGEEERVQGPRPRIVNILVNNFRGIIGFVVPLLILPWFVRKGEHNITVLCVWFWIFWCFLLQPVNNSVTAFIPVFIFPLTGVMSSKEVCLLYFNEYIVLFIACSWLSLLLNHSELDRRLIVWFLCSRYFSKKYPLKSLLIKTSISTYILSMISNRLFVTSKIVEYITEAFEDKPHFDQVSNVYKNAIQTSSSIGSIAIVHSSYATLAFLALWCSSDHGKSTDIFNYLQYSLFAIPVSFMMFVLNLVYHILLMTRLDKNTSEENVKQLRKSLKKSKRSIQKNISFHEKLSFILTLLSLLTFFSRWSKWFGWTYANDSYIADAVVATMFVTLIEILPRDLEFSKYFTAKKRSEMPAEKPTISLLHWKFAEKHTNYGYIYMLGCGVALYKAAKKSKADKPIKKYLGKFLSTLPWSASVLGVCLASAVLANATSGVAALATILPFVLLSNMEHPHLVALGVGIACSFGFAWPSHYTPAYYCHYDGHVPVKIMAKYSLSSILICLIMLWLSLCFWAPLVISSPLTHPMNFTV